MAHILIMPRQGNTVESCVITDWKVKEGDTVSAETVVCEVETDKASFEVPAGAAGTVLKILYTSGDDVPVLKPIAVIGAAGEDWSAAVSQDSSHEGTKTQREESNNVSLPDKEPSVVNQGFDVSSHDEVSGVASPRARNLAKKEAMPLDAVSGTGPGGRIIERDVLAAMQDRPPLTVAAKAAATGTVPSAGSGIGGRATLEDLAATHSPFSSLRAPLSAEGKITETPVKGIRKIISDRMHASLAETAQFTLNASASAAVLQSLRSRIKSQAELGEKLGLSKITVNDLVLFALSRTLPQFPFMNAHKIGDTVRTFERVHMAVAVDTPRGLMVPVIRNANLLSLSQISSEVKRLAAACQNSTAKPDELTGSTFTVSNLGSLGVTSFTPVLNAPEVAILGVCNMEMKPVEANCSCCNCGIRLEPHIGFSLTINHQVVDGAPAARFLKALCDAVANIDLLLTAV